MRDQYIEVKLPWLSPEEPAVEVVKWLVKTGQVIEIDQDILLLLVDGEEFILPAPVDGRITEFLASQGEWVTEGQVLAIVKMFKK